MFILFSPLCQTKHCVEKKIKLKDTNAKLNALITHFPQIVGENNFLQKKKMQDSSKTLLLHIILSERLFKGQNFLNG